MSKIIDKRNSLERFIREQTLGPGINGYRYVDLENEELVIKKIKKEEPINYSSEILDIVPAAIYSTGILFPEEAKVDGNSSSQKEIINNEIITNDDDDEHKKDSQDYSGQDLDSSDTIELNQQFPKTMGLTCCLDESFLSKKTIEFKVNFRYYQKLKQDKEGKFNNKYGLLCEVNNEEIQNFIDKFELNSFRIRAINENHFLLLSKLSSEEITQIKTRIREIQKQIAETLFDLATSFSTIPQLTRASCYLSNLKSSIYYELKNSITNVETRKKLYEVTQNIELAESITDHFRNLLDVFSGGYGLWQSTPVERIIKLENINFPKESKKISYLHNKSVEEVNIAVIKEDGSTSSSLKDIFRFDLDDKKEDYASISANIQLSRDSRKKSDKVFLKIQLLNTSVAFDEAKQIDNRYYSTFNELVNQKSFFGVNLSVKSDYLVPYSNHEYFQEKDNAYSEDTTTAFIYNQFKDFAIGHGCSVKWSKQGEPLMVETEYLPNCETPDIDPIPRDKSRNAVIDYKEGFVSPLFLENTKSQEFKWLSIFSDATDTEIIKGLNDFVDSYERWIELKRQDEKYQIIYSGIAKQELDKCEGDYLRMKKNINVFLSGSSNKDKLDSFRLMNAAMFMQLWHSVKVKQDAANSFINDEAFVHFNFSFYKDIADDKLFSKTESAGWRAFQLAFILLNLDGIFKPEDDANWDKRNYWVDLVWFPTGVCAKTPVRMPKIR